MIRVFLLLLIPCAAWAQADSTDIIVKDFMNRQKIAGLSLAVVKNGKAVTNKGYGMANLEWNLPVTPNTVIRLGSVSKQFFSTAILTLVEAGKIRLT
ncbi:MAG: class A beta-lactamase-related serine hydrolase, partial [Chitinophagaceae bacterium]